MAIITFPYKDPDEYLDYRLDWSLRIGEDPIASSSWSTPMPGGITIATHSMGTFTTTVWLSSGTIGNTYQFTNRIHTEAGRIMDQTCKIKVKAK